MKGHWSVPIGDSATRPKIALSTVLGDVVIEVFNDLAPQTSRCFLQFVDGGAYDRAAFYRAVRPDNDERFGELNLVQGGLGSRSDSLRPMVIPHEGAMTTGVRHLPGVVSFARWKPGNILPEFFIMVRSAPRLDEDVRRSGFAAFGRVVTGMSIISRFALRRTEYRKAFRAIGKQYIAAPVPFVARRL